MHTVVITNRSAEELINNYRTLFDSFVYQGRISFCSWNEEGTDIDTALPGIREIVEDAREWRAVVFFEYENYWLNEDQLFFNEQNPFDFGFYAGGSKQFEDTPIPVIRLTQLLAGLPKLGIKHFDEYYTYPAGGVGEVEKVDMDSLKSRPNLLMELKEEHGHNMKHVFMPIHYDQDEMDKFDELSDRYDDFYHSPKNIILITPRKFNEEISQKIADKSVTKMESTSSDFAIRNGYPHCCRFVCFDLRDDAGILYEEDLFNGCISALLIMLNVMKSDTMQAYKFYRVEAEMDLKELEISLVAHLEKLIAARNYVSDQIRVIDNQVMEGTIEQYIQSSVPVIYSDVNKDDLLTYQGLGLTGNCPSSERAIWQGFMFGLKRQFRKVFQEPTKAIDFSSGALRRQSDDFDGQEFSLTKYDMTELNEYTEDIEETLIEQMPVNVINVKGYWEEVLKKDKDVTDYMRARMTKWMAVAFGVVALSFYLLGFMPYIYNSFFVEEAVVRSSLLFVLLLVVLVGVGGLFSLLILRRRLKKLVKAFNQKISDIIDELNQGAKKFEEYFGLICRYMKCQSIRRGVESKYKSKNELWQRLKRHETILGGIIKSEMRIYNVNNFKTVIEPTSKISAIFDVDDSPRNNPVYFLESDNFEKDVIVNIGADRIKSPYRFVKKLEIERIQQYD